MVLTFAVPIVMVLPMPALLATLYLVFVQRVIHRDIYGDTHKVIHNIVYRIAPCLLLLLDGKGCMSLRWGVLPEISQVEV